MQERLNLGKALLRHQDFKFRGFDIVGAFDCDPFKIGEEVSGLEVVCTRRLKDAVAELGIEIGLITTPVNRVVVSDLLNANFPGRPHLAYFDFADPQPTAKEVFETATSTGRFRNLSVSNTL